MDTGQRTLESGISDPRSPTRSSGRCSPCQRISKRRALHWISIGLIAAPIISTAAGLCSIESITAAQKTYDLGSAQSTLEACELEAPIRTDDSHRELVARAALLVAELHRIDFEATADSVPAQRRALGTLIDDAANTGMEALEGLPETSQRHRLEADLLATKIRSDFRAKKYGKKMKTAAARALELDPNNALAIVSQAKPYLFAEARHGGDLEEAIRLLSEALVIAPALESALVLRALAFDILEETEACERDLRTALSANPQCRPASERLSVQPEAGPPK